MNLSGKNSARRRDGDHEQNQTELSLTEHVQEVSQSSSPSSMPMTTPRAFLATLIPCSKALNFAMAAIKLGSWLSTRTFSRTLTSCPLKWNVRSLSSWSGNRAARPRRCLNEKPDRASDVKEVGVFGLMTCSVRKWAIIEASEMVKFRARFGGRGGSNVYIELLLELFWLENSAGPTIRLTCSSRGLSHHFPTTSSPPLRACLASRTKSRSSIN